MQKGQLFSKMREFGESVVFSAKYLGMFALVKKEESVSNA